MIVSTLLSLFVVPVLYIVIGTARDVSRQAASRLRISKRLHSRKHKEKIAQISPQIMDE